MTTTTTARRTRTLAATAAAAGLVMIGAAVPAAAAPAAPAPSDSDGWVRLGHFSPDTPAVDARLTSVAGTTDLTFEDVTYGEVSGYTRLAAGTYTVAMIPAGAPEGTAPAITQSFDVVPGGAATVAAVGLNADLSGRVIADDLTPAPDGQARVRLIQASVSSPEVDVTTDTGAPIARDAAFGTATDYAQVDAGRWTLDVDGTQSGTVQVDLPGGSVNTLVVLDNGDQISLTALQDAAGTAQAPVGGVATGEGGLVLEADRRTGVVLAVVAGALGAALLGRLAVRRRAEAA
ncbi:DUF4397 domain-containing protein [Litorihabitans aurantiacus]|uniref:DUF4397 domain-containing protein n=1 Tax=Litorihabitans aurantiacus TaxID=1930061 RepID=A0AA38CUS5_9MICO|nr:DUF4397 domain-containing protein [Litorihabitans aurantiacus]GMA32335.1 hypothetical protein GCM10025875_23270 [Litorihabitans aurantiacus]